MKKKLEVNVEAKLQVSLDTAHACAVLLEMWLNENPTNRKLDYHKEYGDRWYLVPEIINAEDENGNTIEANV